jgi:hypothetical protein
MIVNPRPRLLLPTLAVALLASVPASASVARAVPFEEKVGAADAIVLGKVVATESAWDPSHKFIVTRSTFQVEKALKGTPAPQLTLVTPGGSVDGIRQETIGVPSFDEGDERVVFVRSSKSGPTVAFFDQGVYDVKRDSFGAVMVEPAASELVLVDTKSVRAASAAAPAPETLADFERRVGRAMRDVERARLEMAAGAAAEPGGAGALSAFARENRVLLLLATLAVLLGIGFLVHKRP